MGEPDADDGLGVSFHNLAFGRLALFGNFGGNCPFGNLGFSLGLDLCLQVAHPIFSLCPLVDGGVGNTVRSGNLPYREDAHTEVALYGFPVGFPLGRDFTAGRSALLW